MALGTKLGIIASSGAGSSFENIYSLDFDGTDDYLTGSSTFSDLNGATNASFSMWLKPISGGSTLRMVFQIGRGSTALNSQCQLFLYEGNRIDFSVNAGGQYGRGDISSITYGSWNHLVIAVDLTHGGTPECQIFVNGADETTGDNMSSVGSFMTATDELYIGESKTGHYNPFNGNIDEFAIWPGTTLTLAQAQAIYNSGAPTDLASFSPAPSHWWRNGDGDTYPNITDNIGSYNLGMINMASGDIETDVPT
tara:strand:- start:290 stop:1045 length:756 start_codon:yes stop_codon:yes gene_type:complete